MTPGLHLIEYPNQLNEWIDSLCNNRDKSEKYVWSQDCKFKRNMNIIYVKFSKTQNSVYFKWNMYVWDKDTKTCMKTHYIQDVNSS